MNEKKENLLNVVVMTQGDKFFIPQNIRKASNVCNISAVVQVNCKSSLENKLQDYLKWFGMIQCIKMGLLTGIYIIQGMLDKLFGYKLFNGEKSVKSVSKALKTEFFVVSDSNSEELVRYVKDKKTDLIISFSAPQIIREPLLNTPKHGIINVHGSLLPDYRGCLPSFWYLYNEEKIGGATVHYMSSKIDDGDIIKQGSVILSDCNTMFQVMKKTKKLGGELMAKAISDITENKVNRIKNISENGRYFTWPTVEQAKEFRKRGKKLV